MRSAIRDRRKLRIAYVDEKGKRTRRTIWPLAMAYYVDVTLVGAWCELRKDFRNFRVERIAALTRAGGSASRITTAGCSPNGWRCPRTGRYGAVTSSASWRSNAVELRCRQPGMAARGELRAVELEEGMSHRIEAEGVAFLDDDAGGLAPDFDDEGFGHGWISLVSLDMVSIRRFDNG